MICEGLWKVWPRADKITFNPKCESLPELAMTRFALIATFCAIALPVMAEDEISKETDCGYQADVVAAIQTARLDRVKEAKLAEAIAETDPTWPEQYSNAVTVLAGPIYDLKRRDLKKVDLGAQWKEACLSRE